MPDLPTSVPPALAVFNLVEEPWYARMTPEQLEALEGRVRGNEAFAESDRRTVEAFVRCATGGPCDVSPDEGQPPLCDESEQGSSSKLLGWRDER